MLYIISPRLIYLFYNWKFVSFTPFTHFSHLHSLPLATTNLFSVSMNLGGRGLLFLFWYVFFFLSIVW